jgi:hypothetical protein
LISKEESSKRNKINSEITLKYFCLLLLLNMKFPSNFLAGAGVLTAGAGAKITGVCTALNCK